MLLPRLGWRFSATAVVPLADFTVRLGTSMLLAPTTEQRALCHVAFVCEARGLPSPVAPAALAAVDRLHRTFGRVWRRLRWEPARKEVLWRLAVDGVPMLGNSHLHGTVPGPCACGAFAIGSPPVPVSPRLHHFWSCPVARALLSDIEHYCACTVPRASLWLLVSPAPSRIQRCVWDVVALAALGALEDARRYVCARRPLGPAVLARATTVARSHFAAFLRDFAGLGLPAKGWGSVGSDHPLLRVVGGTLTCVI
jgi:hypothetical protein